MGRPIVEAAVEVGVPYVDSTGEPGFMADVYATYADAGTPVVPACAMDYVPGDLAVAIAAEELGAPPTAVLVGYAMRDARASRGTARSALGALGTVEVRPRHVRLPFPDQVRDAMVLPWGEALTVPRHQPQATAESAFVLPSLLTQAAPVLGVTARLAPLVKPLLSRLVELLPEGPPDDRRSDASVDVLAVATAGARRARVLVQCRDVYGLTASLLVEAASRVPKAPAGALAPAQAFLARPFLDAVSGPQLRWRVLSG